LAKVSPLEADIEKLRRDMIEMRAANRKTNGKAAPVIDLRAAQ
jgi:hypothetical protein